MRKLRKYTIICYYGGYLIRKDNLFGLFDYIGQTSTNVYFLGNISLAKRFRTKEEAIDVIFELEKKK